MRQTPLISISISIIIINQIYLLIELKYSMFSFGKYLFGHEISGILMRSYPEDVNKSIKDYTACDAISSELYKKASSSYFY